MKSFALGLTFIMSFTTTQKWSISQSLNSTCTVAWVRHLPLVYRVVLRFESGLKAKL